MSALQNKIIMLDLPGGKLNWQEVSPSSRSRSIQDREVFRRHSSLLVSLSLRLWQDYYGPEIKCSTRRFGYRRNTKLWLLAQDYKWPFEFESWPYARKKTFTRIYRMVGDDRSMFKQEKTTIQRLWWPWHQSLQALAQILCFFLGRYGTKAQPQTNFGASQQRRRLQAFKLLLGISNDATSQSQRFIRVTL